LGCYASIFPPQRPLKAVAHKERFAAQFTIQKLRHAGLVVGAALAVMVNEVAAVRAVTV